MCLYAHIPVLGRVHAHAHIPVRICAVPTNQENLCTCKPLEMLSYINLFKKRREREKKHISEKIKSTCKVERPNGRRMTTNGGNKRGKKHINTQKKSNNLKSGKKKKNISYPTGWRPKRLKNRRQAPQ